MARPRKYTIDEIESEIERLKKSEAVKLAQKEQRLIHRRSKYLSDLLWLESRGKKLEAEGITKENMKEKMFSGIPEDEE